MQIIQFFLLILHDAQLAWVEDCGFPLWVPYVMIPQNLFMLTLFGDFYYKTYIKKQPAMVPRKMETNGISAEISKENSKQH